MAAPSNNGGKTADGKFAPGNEYGQGRPKGSKNKLTDAFIEALHDDFEDNGAKVIKKLRTRDPATYARIIAGFVSKEVEHSGRVEITKIERVIVDADTNSGPLERAS